MADFAVSGVNSGLAGALNSSVQGLQRASRSLSETAQDIAVNGVDGLERNVADLILARTSFKANAAVIRTVEETQDRLLDILV